MRNLVFFDLDGTLIDSREDLAGAINFMRSTYDLPKLPVSVIVAMVGNGMKILVERALAGTEIEISEALKRMKEYYSGHLVDRTVLYSGVEDGLRILKSSEAVLIVVTNKPTSAAVSILKKLGVADYFTQIIGGDSGYPLKPDPTSLLALKELYPTEIENCWMVGDHYTDLEAGRRAEYKRIFVTYGFGDAKTEVPDYTADSFLRLTNIIISR